MSWINKSSTSWCIEETGAIDREGFTGCRHSPSGLEIAIYDLSTRFSARRATEPDSGSGRR
jgi:hypothetical protein